MTKREGGRLGRLFSRDDAPADEESVAMSGNDDHAWWADRRTLAGAPISSQPTGISDTITDQTPAADPLDDRWSAESLFADAGFDPTDQTDPYPPPPPPVDDGTTITPGSATGLDEARLLLGVTADADWRQVTKAHRALAKQFHPDRLGDLSADAQELGQHRMAEINHAYSTLSDHRQA